MTGPVEPVGAGAWEHADVVAASDAYAGRFSGPVGAWFLEVQAAHTLALLGDDAPGNLLEVGGGHAQLTPHLIRAGHDVTVLGSDPACGRRLAEWTATGACRFEVGNLVDLPFPDRSFDAVLAFRLLAHVADWRRLLAEICRVARRCVIVDYPSTRSVNIAARPLYGLKARVEEGTRVFRLFRAAEVRAALFQRGFEVTGRRGQFLFPMALHRALGLAPVSKGLERMASVTGATRMFGSPVISRADRVS